MLSLTISSRNQWIWSHFLAFGVKQLSGAWVPTLIMQKKPRCSQIHLIHHRAHRFSSIKVSAPRLNPELLLNQGARRRWETLKGRTFKIRLLSSANLVEIWFSSQSLNSEGWIQGSRYGKNKELNSEQRGGDYFKSGNKMTRQINGFSEGGGSLALCVLHGAARRAESLLTRRAGV